jgi:hypothetical protein
MSKRKLKADVNRLLAASDLLWEMVDGEHRALHPFTGAHIGVQAKNLEEIATKLDANQVSEHHAKRVAKR